MVEAAAHLSANAQAPLALSVEERLDRLRRPRWIGYTRAKQLLDKLDDLLTHPKTRRLSEKASDE
jgi:Bacterial TniB protein